MRGTPLIAAALVVVSAASPVRAETVHVDTCVTLTPDARRDRNLDKCPVAHLSDNPYAFLERSHHKYILLTRAAPIRLEVKGPGVGFRHLFLWKYDGGAGHESAPPPGAKYTVTIVRDGTEFVTYDFPIRPYPKHPGYGSAERIRTVMTPGTHTYEIRVSSDTPGEVIYYWKVAPIAGRYLLDDWKPWPTR